MPLAVKSLAQLALMPGPPPTMRAISCMEGLSDVVMICRRVENIGCIKKLNSGFMQPDFCRTFRAHIE
jgi:hypothetical protein